MNGIEISTEGQIIVVALACLSLLLLILAGWLGRWPLWVAGWTVALIALAVVFFFRAPQRGSEPEPEAEETLIGMGVVEERVPEGRERR